MATGTLTGSRIRQRRVMMGIKQAELAARAQVSASYLNLIEHNKRRIGGKLLLDIAGILDVEPAALSEGTEATVLAALREAANLHLTQDPELARAEEFAGRFPGWARLIQAFLARQTSLEQTVASLSDRMTHDPQLAEALHDMLGAVTGIRSTSSILASSDEIEPEWRMRFSRNINEDARRLAESSQSLVQFLDISKASGAGAVATPQEEIESWLDGVAHRFEDLEAAEDSSAAIAQILGSSRDVLTSASAQAQAEVWLKTYAADAARLSLTVLKQALTKDGLRPDILARTCQVPLEVVLRRLAALPAASLEAHVPIPAPAGLGLAMCDASGTLTYRKSIPGFALPRFGAACPLWPLYQSLLRPGAPVRFRMVMEGRDRAYFDGYAFASNDGLAAFHGPQHIVAHMLVVPATSQDTGDGGVVPVGTGCRTCAQIGCAARREPSILTSGI